MDKLYTALQWSTIYTHAWDMTPESYVTAGLVGWGRSRRLARYEDRARGLKAYLGIHHNDPAKWGRSGPAQARYFLSIFVAGHTRGLQTYATLPDALHALVLELTSL